MEYKPDSYAYFAFQVPVIPITSVITAAIFFPNALPQSKLDLVSDWLKYQFLLQRHITHPCTRRSWRLSKVQQVELCATCCGTNFAQIPCCASESVSTHERMCRCKMYLKRVPATFSQVCKLCDLVPPTRLWNMSPQCALNTILSPVHVAATSSCNVSPRVGPPLVYLPQPGTARPSYSRTQKKHSFTYFGFPRFPEFIKPGNYNKAS